MLTNTLSRKAWTAVLLLGLLLAPACKTESSSAYPKSVRDNFIASCTDNGATKDQCRCMLDALEDKLTLNEFISLEARAGSDAESAEVEAIVVKCLAEDDKS